MAWRQHKAAQSARRDAARHERKTHEAAIRLMTAVYRSVDGCAISKRGQLALGAARVAEEESVAADSHWTSLTYGEVTSRGFVQIMTSPGVGVRPGEVFYDLGSGTGLAVLTAALAFPQLRECVGVELIKELNEAAEEAQGRALAMLEKPVNDVPGVSEDISVPAGATVISRRAVKSMKPADLKAELKARNLSIQGNKKLLQQRLLDVFGDGEAVVAAASSNPLPPTTKLKLKVACAARAGKDSIVEDAGSEAGEEQMLLRRPAGTVRFETADLHQLRPMESDKPASDKPESAEHWWARADVVYCCNILWSDPLVDAVFFAAIYLAPGSRLISLKELRPPFEPYFIERSKSVYEMSWGMTPVWVFTRNDVPAPARFTLTAAPAPAPAPARPLASASTAPVQA